MKASTMAIKNATQQAHKKIGSIVMDNRCRKLTDMETSTMLFNIRNGIAGLYQKAETKKARDLINEVVRRCEYHIRQLGDEVVNNEAHN